MENETLTTAPVEEQVETLDEQATDDKQVDETTTDYDEAWDNLDLDNVEGVDKILDTPTEQQNDSNEPEPDTEVSEEELATKAFMDAAPVLKFKGKDIPIDSPDEIIALAQKGFLMESEQAKIKPQKKIINTVSEVPIEILQAVADLNDGKQDALTYIKEHYGVKDQPTEDYYGDYNDEPKKEQSTYTPEIPQEDPVKDFWDQVVSQDAPTAAKVVEVYKDIDESFKNEIYQPDMFPAFVESIRTGEFDNVYPLAVKERMFNPAISWIDAYQAAASKANDTTIRNEPPASAQQPRQQSTRQLEGTAAADEIWANDEAFEKMQRDIFQ